MIRNLLLSLIVIALAANAWLWLKEQPVAVQTDPHAHDPGHGGHEEHHDEGSEKGPHGGRLLSADDFKLELAIVETGTPPLFHAWAWWQGQPVTTRDVDLQVSLHRLDGQIDQFHFEPQDEYLTGNEIVAEPHSFDVSISVGYADHQYQWQYPQYEGRVQIDRELADASGVRTAIAGPGSLIRKLALTGRVHADPNRLSHVRARFPGVVRRVQGKLGEIVKRGQVLAQVESNESLQSYAVRAPISGLIVKRDIQQGETTADEPLYTIADLSEVWVELDVYSRDLLRIRVGQSVSMETLAGDVFEAEISWISPMSTHASQSVQARLVLSNPDGRLRPGQFVEAEVITDREEVPLLIRQSALQRFRDFNVVYVRIGDTYEVRMLELGRQDHDHIEVLSGLGIGSEYVVENSYLIKADIEKSGASHDH